MNVMSLRYGSYKHIEIHASRSGRIPSNDNIDFEATNHNIHLAKNMNGLEKDESDTQWITSNQFSTENQVYNRHFKDDLDRINASQEKHGRRTYKDGNDYAKNGRFNKQSVDAVTFTFGSSESIQELRDNLYQDALKKEPNLSVEDFDDRFRESVSKGLANYAKGFNKRNKYLTCVQATTNVDETNHVYGAPHIHMELLNTGYTKYDDQGNPTDDARPSFLMSKSLMGQYPDLKTKKERFAKWREDETSKMIDVVGKQLNHDLGRRLNWQKAENKDRQMFYTMDDFKRAKASHINLDLESAISSQKKAYQATKSQSLENCRLKHENLNIKEAQKLNVKGDVKMSEKIKNLELENAKLKEKYDKADKRNHDLYLEKKKAEKENEKLKKQLQDRSDTLQQTEVTNEQRFTENETLKKDLQDILLAAGFEGIDISDSKSLDDVKKTLRKNTRKEDKALAQDTIKRPQTSSKGSETKAKPVKAKAKSDASDREYRPNNDVLPDTAPDSLADWYQVLCNVIKNAVRDGYQRVVTSIRDFGNNLFYVRCKDDQAPLKLRPYDVHEIEEDKFQNNQTWKDNDKKVQLHHDLTWKDIYAEHLEYKRMKERNRHIEAMQNNEYQAKIDELTDDTRQLRYQISQFQQHDVDLLKYYVERGQQQLHDQVQPDDYREGYQHMQRFLNRYENDRNRFVNEYLQPTDEHSYEYQQHVRENVPDDRLEDTNRLFNIASQSVSDGRTVLRQGDSYKQQLDDMPSADDYEDHYNQAHIQRYSVDKVITPDQTLMLSRLRSLKDKHKPYAQAMDSYGYAGTELEYSLLRDVDSYDNWVTVSGNGSRKLYRPQDQYVDRFNKRVANEDYCGGSMTDIKRGRQIKHWLSTNDNDVLSACDMYINTYDPAHTGTYHKNVNAPAKALPAPSTSDDEYDNIASQQRKSFILKSKKNSKSNSADLYY